jgi:putative glutamine amidotransferase
LKPRIGITSGLGGSQWHADGDVWRAYAEAVESVDGEAVHLCPTTRGRERDVLRDLDGILFSGGMDIDLALYPNPPDLCGESAVDVMTRHRMKPEPDRDSYELPLILAALDRDMPVLGICRGCQLLNVALGGRLILDIPLETRTRVTHRSEEDEAPVHSIEISHDSMLHDILPRDHYREVNSRHHQAVRIDEAFTARLAAVSPEDGLVEAIEVPHRRWAIGVQWHPEHRTDRGIREKYRPLFQRFVHVASKAR